MQGLTKTNNGTTLDPFQDLARDLFGLAPRPVRGHLPSFDFSETETEYLLSGDLPGIAEDKLDITVHDGVLSITGSREDVKEEEGVKFHVRERRFGQFTRRLQLPKDADSENVSAKLENGVLNVRIGKRRELQARKIPLS